MDGWQGTYKGTYFVPDRDVSQHSIAMRIAPKPCRFKARVKLSLTEQPHHWNPSELVLRKLEINKCYLVRNHRSDPFSSNRTETTGSQGLGFI